MVEANLDGNQSQFKKVFLAPDAYSGTIVDIGDVKLMQNFAKDGKVEKLIITFAIKTEADKPTMLPYFVTAKVVKSSGTQGYSNSSLYDLIDKAGLLENFKETWNKIKELDIEPRNEEFVVWLKGNLLNKVAKFTVKTIIPQSGDKYSVFADLIKFEGVDNKPEEKTEDKSEDKSEDTPEDKGVDNPLEKDTEKTKPTDC